MKEIRFTLVADGPSDRALVPVLKWLLRRHASHAGADGDWADVRPHVSGGASLSDKIRVAIELEAPDLVFVHRDAENQSPGLRRDEINAALSALSSRRPAVCVVPVRMTEAWLLFHEAAIRRAADNPNGRTVLQLPGLDRVELEPNPKNFLHNALKEASEMKGRRRRGFRIEDRTFRVANLIDDYSPLRQLSAFRELERELVSVLHRHFQPE